MSAANPVLTSSEVSRLSAVAARLQSDHDGEVVSAGRMLVRLLGKHGLLIADVVERASQPKPVASIFPDPVTPSRSHQRDARRCLSLGAKLWNAKERSFLIDIAGWARPISPAQADWLAGLVAKLDRAGRPQ